MSPVTQVQVSPVTLVQVSPVTLVQQVPVHLVTQDKQAELVFPATPVSQEPTVQ